MRSNRVSFTAPDSSFISPENRLILTTVPERWGRMDRISQVALIEIGKTLRSESLLPDSDHHISRNISVGLIVGSRRGSLATDLIYAETLAEKPAFARPALFSYTLPNIALAEASIHYRLTGPVFSILSENPFPEAVKTAEQWLTCCEGQLDLIIAGELDNVPSGNTSEIMARFTIIHSARSCGC